MVKFTRVEGLSQYEKDKEKNRQIVQSTAKKPATSTGATQKAPSLLEQATSGTKDSRFSLPGTSSLLNLSTEKTMDSIERGLQQPKKIQSDWAETPENTLLSTISGNIDALKKSFSETSAGKAADVVETSALKGMAGFNTQIARTVNLPFQAVSDLFGVENKSPTAAFVRNREQAEQKLSEDAAEAAAEFGKGGEIASTLLSTGVQAVPSAVLAVLSGGSSTVTQLAPKATGVSGAIASGLKSVLSNPMTKTSFLTTVGGEYESARQSGANAGEALVAAIGSSLVQAGIESGGGLEKLPSNLRTGDTSKWLAVLKSGAEEAVEEPVQNIISGAINKGVYDTDRPVFSTTDETAVINPAREAESAAYAFGSGLLLGGAQNLGLSALNRARGQQQGAETTVEQAPTETATEAAQPVQMETAQTTSAIDRAVAEFNQRGAVTNNTATAILNDPVALSQLQQNGLELSDGMTQAQRRSAVKEAVARMQQPQETVSAGAQSVLDAVYGRQETETAPVVETPVAEAPAMSEAAQAVMDAVQTRTAQEQREAEYGQWGVEKEKVQAAKAEISKSGISGSDMTQYDKLVQRYGKTNVDTAFGELLEDNQLKLNGGGQYAPVDPSAHIDNRDAASVSSRRQNAFQYDNPELQPYMSEAAYTLIGDVSNTTRGERFPTDEYGQQWTGVKRNTTPMIAEMKDTYGMTYDQIIKGAEDIIADKGRENNANAKRVETFLDDMLVNGHQAITGENIPPNAEYIRLRNEIPGAASLQQQDTTSVGAAESGFDPFYQLQQNATQFYPVNQQAADQLTTRTPQEVPVMDAQGNRISKTAATALNSPNTSNTMASLIEDQIVKGDLSYAVLPNDVVQQRAQERIKSIGFSDALSQYYRNIDRGGTAAVDNNALGLALYNEAVAAGDDVTAYNILDTLQQNTRDYARAVQVISLMNKLTPAGKLYMVEKTVRNMNAADQSKNNQRNVESAAKSVGKSVSAAVMDENIPAQEWWMEAADRLTASVDRQQQAPGKKTTMQEILSDLKRFAYQTAGERVQRTGNTKTDLDRVKDYLENRDFYDDVWQDAQQLLEEKYEGNEDAIAQYRNWLNSTVTDSINNSLKGKAKPKGNLDQIRAAIESGGFSDSAIRDGLNTYLFGEQKYKVNPELAQAYLEAETDQKRDNILDQIKQDIADQIPSTFMDRFTALRYLNMLGNLKTQGKNVAGNAVMQGARMVKNAIATGIESIVDNGSRLFGGEGIQRTKSFNTDVQLFKAALSDARNVRDILLGAGKFSDQSSVRKDIQDKRTIFKSNAKWGAQPDSSAIATGARKVYDLGWRGLEAYRKITGAAMDKGDLVFSYGAYADSLASYLHANGVTGQQLSDGTVDADLLDKARAYAITEAQKATFRDHNAFSDMVANIGFKNADTFPKKAVNVLVEGTLPFKRTPANVAARIAEYSPVSIVKAAIDGVKRARGTTDLSGAQIIDELAAGLTGSGLLILGAALFNAGVLRGGDDEDMEQQYFDELQGHQSYSLEIDGKSYTIDWTAPVSVPLFVGAELAKYGSSEGLTFDSIMKIGKQMTVPVIQMSMLQGINDAFSSVSYSDDGAMQFVLNAAIDYINQGLTSTLGGQFERTAEDARMTTFTDAETQTGRSLQQALGGALAKVPGLDYNQIPFVDAWGRVEENENKFLTGLENFISPGYGDTVETTPVDEIIQAVYDETGNKSVLPDRITDRTITVDGVEHKLTAQQYTDRQITYGQTRRSILEAAYNSGALQNMTAKEQEQFMVNAKELAAEVAKQELLQSMGLEYTPSKALQTADSGVGLENYAVFDGIYSVMDKEDEENKIPDSATAVMAIEKAGITDKETAAALWASKNSTTSADKNPYSGAMGQSGLTSGEIVDIITNADGFKKQYEETADRRNAFTDYLDGMNLSDKEYNAAMFQAGYQKSYNYDTMSDTQKAVWDNWGSSQYDMDEFLKLYQTMTAAGKKADAVQALYDELGDRTKANQFYRQANKDWD